jgi:hypothetical protein
MPEAPPERAKGSTSMPLMRTLGDPRNRVAAAVAASKTCNVPDLGGQLLFLQRILHVLNGRQIIRTVGEVEDLDSSPELKTSDISRAPRVPTAAAHLAGQKPRASSRCWGLEFPASADG